MRKCVNSTSLVSQFAWWNAVKPRREATARIPFVFPARPECLESRIALDGGSVALPVALADVEPDDTSEQTTTNNESLTELTFSVSAVTPADGSRFATAPTSIRLDFTAALDLPSLQASDLTIDGESASGLTIVDSDTVEFVIAPPGPGTHVVALGAGAVMDMQGTPVSAFSASFTVDNVAPRIVSTSLQDGTILPAGSVVVTIGFSEPMKTANLSAGDLTLKGTVRNSTYIPESLSFDATGTQLSVTYKNLPEDTYTLTLLSADGAFEDVVGRNLDGEPVASPLPLNQSGNGVEGGNYSVSFQLDVDNAPLIDWKPVQPAGSLVYDQTFTAVIGQTGDADSYTFTLKAGETIAFITDPGATLQPSLTLRNAQNAVVANAVAASPGQQIFLQAITAEHAGTYTLAIEGAAQTQGIATVRAVLNAVIEPETQSGTQNNSLETAADLDSYLSQLPGGGSRGAIVGKIEGAKANDFYGITLNAGDHASFAIGAGAGNGLRLELQDATGTVLAIGASATDLSLVIHNFVSSAGGKYYLRVTGDLGGNYNLLALRNIDFDSYGNDTQASARSIGQSGTVLGHGGPVSLNRLFAYDSVANLIREVDPNTGQVLRSFPSPAAEVPPTGALGLATTGTTLLVAGAANNAIYELNPDTGTTIRTIPNAISITGIAFSDGEIYLQGASSPIRVLDYATGALKRTFSPSGSLTGSLAAGNGVLLSIDPSDRISQIDPRNGTVTRLEALPGIGTASGLGVIGDELFIADGSEIEVFDLSTYAPKRTLRGFSSLHAVGGDTSLSRDDDYFQIHATAGATLTITTTDPYGRSSGFDPSLRVYDATGQLVASDNNSGPDGRNAELTYQVPASGVYTISVKGVSRAEGDYVLQVNGAELVPSVFAVSSTVPTADAVLSVAPKSLRIDFNHELLLTSLQAGDFVVNGVPATEFKLIDGNTIDLTLPANLPQGTHSVSIAAGALSDVSGVGLEAFQQQFTIDLTPPRVTSINIQKDDSLAPGALSVVVGFSEPIKKSNITGSDVTLNGAVLGRTYVPSNIAFNAAGDTATVTYALLPEDSYTLTLLSSSSSFTDLAGRLLDGETTAWPIPGNQSGNGTDGGNFVVTFSVDASKSPFPAFTPITPLGGLVYGSSASVTISSGTDSDSLTLALEAGQALTIAARPSPNLQSSLVLLDGAGNVVGSATAANAGADALIHLPVAPTSGLYTLTFSSVSGTTGTATLQALLNTSVELENLGGASNDRLTSAQNINALFKNLGNGGSAARISGVIDVFGGLLPVEVEPNNSLGQANPASTDFEPATGQLFQLAIRGNIGATGDVDYFKLGTLQAGAVVSISEAGLGALRGTLGDGKITLYRGSTGAPVTVKSQSFGGPGGDPLIFRFTLPETDTYFISASEENFGTGSYDLALFLESAGHATSGGATLLAETEGNDTVATANDASSSWRPVQYVSRISGELIGDEADVYSYQFTAGDLVSVNIDLADTAFLRVTLIDASGVAIAMGDGGGSGTDLPIYAFRVPADGTYSVRVAGGSVFTDEAYTAEVYLSSVTPPPAPQPSDDFYALTLAAGEQVSFAISSSNGQSVQVALQDSTGTTLAIGGHGLANYAGLIQEFTASAGGTYYLKITGENGAAYQFVAMRNGSFDNESNDSFAEAQGLANGDIVAGHAGYSVLGRLYVHDEPANTIKQLDPKTGAVLRSFPSPITANDYNFGLATTGRTLLASGGGSELIYELDPDSGAILRTITSPDDQVNGLAFLGDEIFVLTGSPLGKVTVLDYATGAVKRTFTAAGVLYGLASADGALLGTGMSNALYEIDPITGVTTIRSGLLFSTPSGLGVIGDELFISGPSGLNVFHYGTLELLRTFTGLNAEAVGADAGGMNDADFYRIQAVAGATLTFNTSTPGSLSLNALDPAIDLYDAAGTLIMSNDNGAADGRNATISFMAPSDGTYYVQVRAVNGTRGEYGLRVEGGQEVIEPFVITQTTPGNGAIFVSAPEKVRVAFNQVFAPSSINAGDLTVDGVKATAVTIIDGSTAEFTLPSGLAAGRHEISFDAGSVTALSGVPLTAFSSEFEVDIVPPRIVGVSLQDGGYAQAGTFSYVIEFSEPMNTALLGFLDLELRGQLSKTTSFSPTLQSYDATGKILTLTWANLRDDAYTLTLQSEAGAFEDLAGILLDGEANGVITPQQASGDGVAGGDFVTHFTLDATTPVAVNPPVARNPFGTLVANTTVSTLLASAGDEDSFTVTLNAGETLFFAVDPGQNLQPAVTVRDSLGAVVAVFQASAAGETIYSPSLTATSSGTYSISLSGMANSVGDAVLNVVRNGVLEMESGLDATNDTLATAQNLTSSLVSLGANVKQTTVTGNAGGSDWYRVDLVANETLTAFINDTDNVQSRLGELEITDATGAVLFSAQPGVFADRAIHGFQAPVTGTYYIHVKDGAGGYQLLTTLNGDMQDGGLTTVPQQLGDASAVLGTLKSPLNTVFVYSRSFSLITEINPSTGRIVRSSLAPFSFPSDIGLASTGSTLIVAGQSTLPMMEYDPRTGSVLREITKFPFEVSGIAFRDGEIFVLSDVVGGEIKVLDYMTGTVKRTIFTDVLLEEGLAASGTHLFGIRGNVVYQIDPETGFTSELVTVPVSMLIGGRIEGLGFFGENLYFGANGFGSSGALIEYKPTTGGLRFVNSAVSTIEGISGDAPQPEGQLFAIDVPAPGTKLKLSTLTPGGSRNLLNPRIELIDPTGAVVASDTNSARDGINAQLTYTPTVAGTYMVRIVAESGEGQYVLHVAGPDSVNDAPVLDTESDVTLPAQMEDAATVTPVRVADLLGLNTPTPRVTDLNVDALAGIAITAADSTNGTWEFSLDGNTWVSFETVSEANARLLASEALVRFIPNPDFHGMAQLSYRAWDQTSGTNGGTADTTLNGGITAFSVAQENATVSVLPVNDAPEVSRPFGVITREDVSMVFSAAGNNGLSIHDVDTDAVDVRITLSAVEGTLTLSTITGLTFSDGDGSADGAMTFTGRIEAINAALEGLVFTPAEEFAGQAALLMTVDELEPDAGNPFSVSATVPIQVTPVIEFTGSTTFTDADGDLVKVVLKGGGRGEIWFPELGAQDAMAIVLDGTSSISTLSIITSRGAETVIGDLIVNGAIRSITAATTDIRGTLEVKGAIGSLVLDDVEAGSVIRLHSDLDQPISAKDTVTLKFGRVTDTSLHTGGLAVTSLSAIDWRALDEQRDAIIASSLGKLKITGNKKEKIAGDLGAAIELTGTAKSIQIAGDATADIDALSIGSLQIGGNFADAEVNLSQAVDVNRAKILALGSLKVGGVLDNTAIESAGRIGAITLGGMRNSRIFAGVSDDSSSLPDENADFMAAASINSLSLVARDAAFINSQVAASSVGRISLKGLTTENGDTAFGIAADRIAMLTLQHAGKTNRYKNLTTAGNAVEIDDFVVRVV